MARNEEGSAILEKEAFPRNIFMQPLTQQPITVPKSKRWQQIALEYHQQPPGECRYALPRHTIRIALQPYLPFERSVDGERLQGSAVTRGDITFCPAGEPQWMRWLAPAEFLLLSLHPALFTSLAEEAGIAGDSLEFTIDHAEIQDPLIFQIGQAFHAELTGEISQLSELYIDMQVRALAAYLLRRYCRYSGKKTFALPAAERLAPAISHSIAEYIQTYLDHSLSITELAAVAGISPYYFARCFKQTFGVSPHQYVLRERIERAKTILLTEEHPLAELATRLGFADQSHFIRQFKRFTGLTPRAFVLQYRKNLPS